MLSLRKSTEVKSNNGHEILRDIYMMKAKKDETTYWNIKKFIKKI